MERTESLFQLFGSIIVSFSFIPIFMSCVGTALTSSSVGVTQGSYFPVFGETGQDKLPHIKIDVFSGRENPVTGYSGVILDEIVEKMFPINWMQDTTTCELLFSSLVIKLTIHGGRHESKQFCA